MAISTVSKDRVQGYRTHTIQVGDSIQRLAVMYKIPDWKDIVYINDLEYPFIFDLVEPSEYDNNPRVATVGSTILIPSDYLTPPYASHFNDMATLEKLAYGSDLDIFTFDPEWSEVINLERKGELSADPDGDLYLSEGIRNLRQRLLIRLMVSKGSMMLHPKFGSTIKSMVGLKGTAQNYTKMRLEVTRCIRSDKLIKDVANVTVKKVLGGVEITADVVPFPPYTPFKFASTINED